MVKVKMTAVDLDRAVELIAGASSVGLVCHVDPDGDALGSLLGLHHLCRANAKASVASWPEPFRVAPHYAFLPGLDDCTKPADFPSEPEVMVTFDCGSLQRLNELAEPARRAADRGGLIVLDHHRTNQRYGSVNVIDPSAAATVVLVHRLAGRLGWDLDRNAALCLYTGLVTDTGRFQYEATTPEVFTLAAELSAFDLPISSMSRQLFEEHRFAYLKLIAACLDRAVLDRDLHFVATWITARDLEEHGVSIEETEGLIDLVRRAKEADVACVLKETDAGVRVSLRSVGAVDVSQVATRFGGGGHAFASGFVAPGPVERVLDEVRAAVAAQRGWEH
jgi:bifunctional oligoribonuclease and PAP phosphatase NrnA